MDESKSSLSVDTPEYLYKKLQEKIMQRGIDIARANDELSKPINLESFSVEERAKIEEIQNKLKIETDKEKIEDLRIELSKILIANSERGVKILEEQMEGQRRQEEKEKEEAEFVERELIASGIYDVTNPPEGFPVELERLTSYQREYYDFLRSEAFQKEINKREACARWKANKSAEAYEKERAQMAEIEKARQANLLVSEENERVNPYVKKSWWDRIRGK